MVVDIFDSHADSSAESDIKQVMTRSNFILYSSNVLSVLN